MPKFCMPAFGNGRNNTKIACIFLYRVRIPTWIGKPGAIRLAEKLALVAFRLFPRPLSFLASVCFGAIWEGTSVCHFKSVATWWLRGRISACAARYWLFCAQRVLVLLLSSLLSMLSGEIYLRLKPYLVVKIYSDIVTEHCCQVCVLTMRFYRCAAVCWHGKWLRNQDWGEPCGLT